MDQIVCTEHDTDVDVTDATGGAFAFGLVEVTRWGWCPEDGGHEIMVTE